MCACEGRLTPVVYDRAAVFDHDLTMLDPIRFHKDGLEAVLGKKQTFVNKIP